MSNLGVVKLNGRNFIFSVELRRLDDETGELNPDKTMVYGFTQTKSLRGVTFSNDLFEPCPQITVVISDAMSNTVSTFHADGYSTLVLNFSDASQETDVVNISHEFVIDSIVSKKSDDESLVTIECTSMLYTQLNSQSTYTTGTEEKSASKVMFELLTESDFAVDVIGQDSSTKLHYIAPVNETIYGTMMYLKDKAFDVDTGPFFWFYDFPSDKILISCTNSIHTRSGLDIRLKPLNRFVLPSFGANADMNTTAKMRNIESSVAVTGSDLISYGGKYGMVQFSRELSSYSLKVLEQVRYGASTNNHSNMKTDGTISLNKPAPSHITKNGKLSYDREFPKSYKDGPSERMEDIFRFTDVMQFNTDGELGRGVGDLIFITSVVDTDVSSPMKRFNGEWVITRLISSIQDGTYTDSIVAVRSDMSKEGF